jgi:hypothetical protein
VTTWVSAVKRTSVDNLADEFFERGDTGTYDGGPNTIAPVLIESVEEIPTTPTAAQLERRERYVRMVGVVMAGLSAWILVALVVSLRASAEPRSPVTFVAAGPTIVETVATTSDATPRATDGAPPVPAPEPEQSAASAPPAERPAAVPPRAGSMPMHAGERPEPIPRARAKHVPSSEPMRAPKPALATRLSSTVRPVSSPHVSASYTPPTARFSD